MAQVYLDPQFQEFAEEARRELERNGVRLSEYAEGLLGLSVEAWFKEAPYETDGVVRSRETPQELARMIIRRSLEDPHIRLAREKNRPVYLHDLMATFVETAKEVLGKGH
jgi:hypothetical protein